MAPTDSRARGAACLHGGCWTRWPGHPLLPALSAVTDWLAFAPWPAGRHRCWAPCARRPLCAKLEVICSDAIVQQALLWTPARPQVLGSLLEALKEAKGEEEAAAVYKAAQLDLHAFLPAPDREDDAQLHKLVASFGLEKVVA
jgi:hypothetical protein